MYTLKRIEKNKEKKRTNNVNTNGDEKDVNSKRDLFGPITVNSNGTCSRSIYITPENDSLIVYLPDDYLFLLISGVAGGGGGSLQSSSGGGGGSSFQVRVNRNSYILQTFDQHSIRVSVGRGGPPIIFASVFESPYSGGETTVNIAGKFNFTANPGFSPDMRNYSSSSQPGCAGAGGLYEMGNQLQGCCPPEDAEKLRLCGFPYGGITSYLDGGCGFSDQSYSQGSGGGLCFSNDYGITIECGLGGSLLRNGTIASQYYNRNANSGAGGSSSFALGAPGCSLSLSNSVYYCNGIDGSLGSGGSGGYIAINPEDGTLYLPLNSQNITAGRGGDGFVNITIVSKCKDSKNIHSYAYTDEEKKCFIGKFALPIEGTDSSSSTQLQFVTIPKTTSSAFIEMIGGGGGSDSVFDVQNYRGTSGGGASSALSGKFIETTIASGIPCYSFPNYLFLNAGKGAIPISGIFSDDSLILYECNNVKGELRSYGGKSAINEAVFSNNETITLSCGSNCEETFYDVRNYTACGGSAGGQIYFFPCSNISAVIYFDNQTHTVIGGGKSYNPATSIGTQNGIYYGYSSDGGNGYQTDFYSIGGSGGGCYLLPKGDRLNYVGAFGGSFLSKNGDIIFSGGKGLFWGGGGASRYAPGGSGAGNFPQDGRYGSGSSGGGSKGGDGFVQISMEVDCQDEEYIQLSKNGTNEDISSTSSSSDSDTILPSASPGIQQSESDYYSPFSYDDFEGKSRIICNSQDTRYIVTFVEAILENNNVMEPRQVRVPIGNNIRTFVTGVGAGGASSLKGCGGGGGSSLIGTFINVAIDPFLKNFENYQRGTITVEVGKGSINPSSLEMIQSGDQTIINYVDILNQTIYFVLEGGLSATDSDYNGMTECCGGPGGSVNKNMFLGPCSGYYGGSGGINDSPSGKDGKIFYVNNTLYIGGGGGGHYLAGNGGSSGSMKGGMGRRCGAGSGASAISFGVSPMCNSSSAGSSMAVLQTYYDSSEEEFTLESFREYQKICNSSRYGSGGCLYCDNGKGSDGLVVIISLITLDKFQINNNTGICKNDVSCNNNGYCLLGICYCSPFWSGSSCSIRISDHSNNSSGQLTCSSSIDCSTDIDTLFDCIGGACVPLIFTKCISKAEESSCYSITGEKRKMGLTEYCKYNGIRIQDYCFCRNGHTGKNCEFGLDSSLYFSDTGQYSLLEECVTFRTGSTGSSNCQLYPLHAGHPCQSNKKCAISSYCDGFGHCVTTEFSQDCLFSNKGHSFRMLQLFIFMLFIMVIVATFCSIKTNKKKIFKKT